ncbi:MAG: DEAD/DEAH box helicase [Thermoplasmatota archaeon]
MKVLHSVYDPENSGSLLMFLESSSSLKKKRGRPPKNVPAYHPNILRKDELVNDLKEVFLDIGYLETVTVEMGFPYHKKKPVLSTEPIEEEKVNREAVLKDLRIDCVRVEVNDILDLLVSLPDKAPHGFKFGDSLLLWSKAARLVLEMISGHRYVPIIRLEMHEGGFEQYHGRWIMVPDAADRERMTMLAGAMPPLCSNFSGTSTTNLVEDFMNTIMDDFLRTCFEVMDQKRKSASKNPASEWWRSLTEKDSVYSMVPRSNEPFAERIVKWSQSLEAPIRSRPFRTCFKLDPPQPGDDRWSLGFYLQASDDPSLIIPPDVIWKETSDTLNFLGRTVQSPQETFLEDLGRASSLCSEIESCLEERRPKGKFLDTPGAYRFLRESAPLLQSVGMGVMLPSWWKKERSGLGIKMTVRPKQEKTTSTGFFGLKGLVSYDWKIAVGEKTLSEEEFERIASLKVPLVQVKGQWVEIRKDEIEKAISYFKKKGEMSLAEALRLERDITGLPVISIDGEGEIGQFLRGVKGKGKIRNVKQPAGFHGSLRPYQLRGLSWLAFLKEHGLGGCLADDMGLGKTIQVISLLLKEREMKERPKATLIVCPMSVVGNWKKEIERFAPELEVMVHHGTDRYSGEEFEGSVSEHDAVITTYALAARDLKTLSGPVWENVVLDEAQNIKNRNTKQTIAVKKLKSENRIALTGTPVENRLSELWSIMDFLDPGYLEGPETFRKKFAIPIERYRDRNKSDMLKDLTHPFILRRLKTDKSIIRDLPEKIEMKVLYNLTREQATLYEAIVKDMIEQIDSSEGIRRKGLVLSALMKLKQVCNHPAHLLADGSELKDRSGKLIRVEEMLEEALSEGDRVLIFTQFSTMGEMLKQYLEDRFSSEVLFLHGGTSKKARDKMVSRFQSEDGPSLFILSLKAGGLGLNLTSANRVFHFDRWWNPAVENQATDRAFRIGQKKNVHVHKFVCIGTLEERIDRMIEEKKELADSVIGTGENWLTELSTNRLRKLFELGSDAVGGE